MQSQDLKTWMEKRLASYGAMSLAVATGVLASPAHAGILITDTSAWAGNQTTSGPVYFNPSTGLFGNVGTAAFGLYNIPATASSGAKLVLKGINSGAGLGTSAGGQFARQFTFNSLISTANAGFGPLGRLEASAGTSDSPGPHLGLFNTGDNGYLALEENGHFGWAHVLILPNFQAELLGFAMGNDQGVGVIPSTGEVPEPSSLLLLGLGAMGVAAYRRKAAAK